MSALGPIGRLGRLAAEHRGRVFVAWALIAVGLGILAPRVETALSGAGWQANGSESVQAREQIDRNFAGQAATRSRSSSTRGTWWRPRPGSGKRWPARSAFCGAILPSVGSSRRSRASRSRPTATRP